MSIIKTKIFIRSKVQGLYSLDPAEVFCGADHTDITTFVGYLYPTKEVADSFFDVPIDVDETDYTTFSISIENNTINNYYIYDTYPIFYFSESTSLDTTNLVAVYETGYPLHSSYVDTTNEVKLRRGKHYVLDYFTPTDWWDFGDTRYFSFKQWNSFENILNNFGRFFHSPLKFSSTVPYFETYKFDLTSGEVPAPEDCSSCAGIVGGFSFYPNSHETFKTSTLKLSPNIYIDSGTMWVADVEQDKTGKVSVYFKEFDGVKYVDYTGEGSPYTMGEDEFFYVMLFNKR